MALTKRLVKGSAITAAEHDANLDHVIDRANHSGAQAISTVTGLQAALDGKQASGSYAAASHNHALSSLSDVEAGPAVEGEIPVYRSGTWTFEAKPAAGSNPAIADITDWPAGVSATEVGYLDGVTGPIQTQLDGKQVAGSYATAAQGALADTALQPNDPLPSQTVSASRALAAGDIGEILFVDTAGLTITLDNIGATAGATTTIIPTVATPNITIASGTATANAPGGYTLASNVQRLPITIVWESATAATVIGGAAS